MVDVGVAARLLTWQWLYRLCYGSKEYSGRDHTRVVKSSLFGAKKAVAVLYVTYKLCS